ncbi:hypothetical protein ACIQRE_05205 [Streptomyces griseoluteus]
MSVAGTWHLSVSTPVGRIKAMAELRNRDGRLPSSTVTGERRPERERQA